MTIPKGKYTKRVSLIAILFLTMGLAGAEPTSAAILHPFNGARGVPLEGDTLRWEHLGSASSYDVYLSADRNAVAVAGTDSRNIWKGNTAAPFFPTGKLQAGTAYYWRVDGVAGTAGNKVKGEIQSFTATKSTLVTRLNGGKPIIDSTTQGAIGSDEKLNINGPSMIRVPDWIPPAKRAHPSAVYYLYFAHHGGKHIRLAWAVNISGPYTVYNPGKGVLQNEDVSSLMYGHTASPDVHVDNLNRRIIMYVHGANNGGYKYGQSTVVALSPFGLDFTLPGLAGAPPGTFTAPLTHDHGEEDLPGLEAPGPVDAVLGAFYARVFEYKGDLCAITNFGYTFKARNPKDPWNADFDGDGNIDIKVTGDNREYLWKESRTLVEKDFPSKTWRHNAVRVRGDTLDIWFTTRAESPERIRHTKINLAVAGGMDNWEITPPQDVLEPELLWEGADLPLTKSRNGSATGVRELRDPAVFNDIDGKMYLFYSGRGEEGIGIGIFNQAMNTPTGMRLSDSDFRELELYSRNGSWELSTYLSKSFSVRLYDGSGKLLQGHERKGSSILTVPIWSLKSGVYFLSVRFPGGKSKIFRRCVP